MTRTILAATAAAVLAVAAPAGATVLTFDTIDIDLSAGDKTYGGLTFSSPYLHGGWLPSPASSASNGTKVYAIGSYGSPLTITRSGGGTFTLGSFDLGLGVYYNTPPAATDPAKTLTVTLELVGGETVDYTYAPLLTFQPIDFGGVDVLSITFLDTNGYVYIDNLDVDAVPEPASWAMLIAGFGLIGGAMRRRAPRFARG